MERAVRSSYLRRKGLLWGGKAFLLGRSIYEKRRVSGWRAGQAPGSQNPEGTITATKRKMGTNFNITYSGKNILPADIRFYFAEDKKDAEAYLGER